MLPGGEPKKAVSDPCLSFLGADGEEETVAERDDVAFLFKFVELNILLDCLDKGRVEIFKEAITIGVGGGEMKLISGA